VEKLELDGEKNHQNISCNDYLYYLTYTGAAGVTCINNVVVAKPNHYYNNYMDISTIMNIAYQYTLIYPPLADQNDGYSLPMKIKNKNNTYIVGMWWERRSLAMNFGYLTLIIIYVL